MHEQVFFFRGMLFTGSLSPNPSFLHQAEAVGHRGVAAFPLSPQVRWICQPNHAWDVDPRLQSSRLPRAGFAVGTLTSSVWALLSQAPISPELSCLDRPWKRCFWVELFQLGGTFLSQPLPMEISLGNAAAAFQSGPGRVPVDLFCDACKINQNKSESNMKVILMWACVHPCVMAKYETIL